MTFKDILHFLGKVLVGFVGWYIFSTRGILPEQLMNPVYKYYHIAPDFQIYYEEMKISQGCYEQYINTRQNCNLSVSNLSPLGRYKTNTFAYTSGDKTYFTLGERLFVTEKEDMSYSEIYSKLISPLSCMAKIDDELLFLGDGDVSDRSLHHTDKVNNVITGWYETYVKDADFAMIANRAFNILLGQQNSRISSDEFSFLLYCQSMGILVDFDDGQALFVDNKEDKCDVYKYTKENGLEFFTEIYASTGYFCADGKLYYVSGNVLRSVNLEDASVAKEFTAQDEILSLNYFYAPATSDEINHENYNGQKEYLYCALLTEKQVVYVNEYFSFPHTHAFDTDSLHKKASGLYVTAYPYKCFLVYDDKEGGNYMTRYWIRG